MNIYKYGKNLRCGYTTGACAAAAAGAAARMLLSGAVSAEEELLLNGELASFFIEEAEFCGDGARCAVRKDAGDDIDVTHGLLVVAEVRFLKDGVCDTEIVRASTIKTVEKTDSAAKENAESVSTAVDEATEGAGAAVNEAAESAGVSVKETAEIIIRGGEGVGRVTKPGLDQPVGEAAINTGPRRMIKSAVMSVMEEYGCHEIAELTISVPGGREAAEKTFNPMLGIEGGISILGSTGIVEPMSEPAVVETIKAELKVKWLEIDGADDEDAELALVPGNYGISFVRDIMGIDDDRIIKCSNFIGDAIDCACGLGVRRLLIAGNLGKLVKLAGGIFNTHSRNADCRMDILMRCAVEACSLEAENFRTLLYRLDTCVTTDAALEVLEEYGVLEQVMELVMKKAAHYVGRRKAGAKQPLTVRIVMISNEMEILGDICVE